MSERREVFRRRRHGRSEDTDDDQENDDERRRHRRRLTPTTEREVTTPMGAMELLLRAFGEITGGNQEAHFRALREMRGGNLEAPFRALGGIRGGNQDGGPPSLPFGVGSESPVSNLPEQFLGGHPERAYYCHTCNRRVTAIMPDVTCSQCQGGFLEELPPNPAPLASITIIRSLNTHGSPPGSPTVGGLRRQPPDIADALNLITNLLAPPPMLRFNLQLPLAFTDDRLDDIITQLLEELEGGGHPPMPEEEIGALPIVIITDQHVHNGLQCSICMEDFKSGDEVNKLRCEHLFHQGCIVPWLQLHGTCPICRTTLSSNTSNDGAREGSGPELGRALPEPEDRNAGSLGALGTRVFRTAFRRNQPRRSRDEEEGRRGGSGGRAGPSACGIQ